MVEETVCVLCGTPWGQESPFTNVCENPDCRGFCTWGPSKGADPTSWIRTEEGWIPRPPPRERA